jgi:hypothetical protein
MSDLGNRGGRAAPILDWVTILTTAAIVFAFLLAVLYAHSAGYNSANAQNTCAVPIPLQIARYERGNGISGVIGSDYVLCNNHECFWSRSTSDYSVVGL